MFGWIKSLNKINKLDIVRNIQLKCSGSWPSTKNRVAEKKIFEKEIRLTLQQKMLKMVITR